ncbi:hypothetical protein [Psychrobacillus phage Spoks]|nr:hypothetical protein [Psychrobacillus phage Spoks]
MEDLYAWCIVTVGMTDDIFWNLPLPSFNRILDGMIATASWKNNPKTTG